MLRTSPLIGNTSE